MCKLYFQRWSWKQLKNIMYKEKKFIMEIIDNNHHFQLKHTISNPGLLLDHTAQKKLQSSVAGEAITTHTWYSNPKVVLALWRMAKVQHKFSKGKSTSVRKLISFCPLFICCYRVMHWTQLNWSRGWIHCWLPLAIFGGLPVRARTVLAHQDPVTLVCTVYTCFVIISDCCMVHSN